MMAAPFLAFAVSIALALGGRARSSLLVLGLALGLSSLAFLFHLSDPLIIGL